MTIHSTHRATGFSAVAVDSILADLDAVVEHDAPIGPRMTWYGIGGAADTLVRPRSVEALLMIVRRCRETGTPLRVLGSGANLLVADEGIDGIVVHLDQPAFREGSAIHRHRANRGGDGTPGDGVRVMAGAQLERLVMSFAREGMCGLEPLAGVPASVGGAVRMNAGGRFGCIGDAVAAVGCITLEGALVVHQREVIEFGYRRTSIVDPVILWAEFHLTPEDPAKVHGRVKEIFAYKKKSQPLAASSAGCVFKNPRSAENPSERLSAGALIDRAGLKGESIGGATISDRHANFFIARQGCRAADLIRLIELAERGVRDEFGIELRRELVVWRRRGEGRSLPHDMKEGADE